MRSLTRNENVKLGARFPPCPSRRKPLVAKKYGRRTRTSGDNVPILLERKKIGFLADLDDLEGAQDVSAGTRIRRIVFQRRRIPDANFCRPRR